MVIAPHHIMSTTSYLHAIGMETLDSQQPGKCSMVLERTSQDVADLRSMTSNAHAVEIVNNR